MKIFVKKPKSDVVKTKSGYYRYLTKVVKTDKGKIIPLNEGSNLGKIGKDIYVFNPLLDDSSKYLGKVVKVFWKYI